MFGRLCLVLVLTLPRGHAQGETTTLADIKNVTTDDDSWKVRLVGGNSSKEGTVEVFINGSWGTICEVHSSFGYSEANVVCRALGFDYSRTMKDNVAVHDAYFGQGSGQVKLASLDCSGEEGRLQDCHVTVANATSCQPSTAIGVVCDYSWQAEDVQVRLADGADLEGRVEVFHQGHWGRVCGYFWDAKDARVVCRQLGLPDGEGVIAEEVASAGPGPADQKVHLNSLRCLGTEQNVGHCPMSYPWGAGYCPESYVAGVACLSDDGPWMARLVNGTRDFEGRVEVSNDKDTWTTICDEDFNEDDAKVICRMLGNYSSDHFILDGTMFGSGSGPVNITRLGCSGSESSIRNCRKSSPQAGECPHSRDVAVACAYTWRPENISVRIAGSGSEGLVEVLVGDTWGSVCGAGWSEEQATVICRQLALSFAGKDKAYSWWYGYEDTPSTQRVFLTRPRCTGNETNIGHCERSSPLGAQACRYSGRAAVRCVEDIPTSHQSPVTAGGNQTSDIPTPHQSPLTAGGNQTSDPQTSPLTPMTSHRNGSPGTSRDSGVGFAVWLGAWHVAAWLCSTL